MSNPPTPSPLPEDAGPAGSAASGSASGSASGPASDLTGPPGPPHPWLNVRALASSNADPATHPHPPRASRPVTVGGGRPVRVVDVARADVRDVMECGGESFSLGSPGACDCDARLDRFAAVVRADAFDVAAGVSGSDRDLTRRWMEAAMALDPAGPAGVAFTFDPTNPEVFVHARRPMLDALRRAAATPKPPAPTPDGTATATALRAEMRDPDATKAELARLRARLADDMTVRDELRRDCRRLADELADERRAHRRARGLVAWDANSTRSWTWPGCAGMTCTGSVWTGWSIWPARIPTRRPGGGANWTPCRRWSGSGRTLGTAR